MVQFFIYMTYVDNLISFKILVTHNWGEGLVPQSTKKGTPSPT